MALLLLIFTKTHKFCDRISMDFSRILVTSQALQKFPSFLSFIDLSPSLSLPLFLPFAHTLKFLCVCRKAIRRLWLFHFSNAKQCRKGPTNTDRFCAQPHKHARTHFHRFINGLCDWRGKEARYRVLRTVMYIHVDRHRVVVRTTTATVTAAVATNNIDRCCCRCCCWAVYRRRSFRSLAKHLIVTRLCSKSYVFHMHSHYSYYVSTHTQRCYFKKKCLTFILFLLWLSLLIFLIELCAKNNRFYKKRIDELILLLVVVVAASPAVYCGSWCDWV